MTDDKIMICARADQDSLYRQLRPRTFFEGGVVGHVSMADPYDRELSALIAKAVGKEGVLQGGVKLHDKGSVVCIGTFSLSFNDSNQAWGNISTLLPNHLL